jgi:acyl carrier protein
MSNILAELKSIIANELDVNIKLADISDDAPLFEGGLGLDSIAVMAFITLIEEHFHFQFKDDELNLSPFQNLQILADFINSKVSQPVS